MYQSTPCTCGIPHATASDRAVSHATSHAALTAAIQRALHDGTPMAGDRPILATALRRARTAPRPR